MPPKAAQGSKKAEAKAKQKVIEDKTFGLKNKNKSAKVGKYIQTVEAQVKQGNAKSRVEEADKKTQLERKKAEEARKLELAALFKPAMQQQKVAPGVDPKTVVCVYFKSGQCAKGDKCKFSHDLAVERKSVKINLYEDRRDGAGGEGAADGPRLIGGVEARPEDSMENWDQSKLEQVINRRHGKGVKTTTEIVCKYFLEAIEKNGYGWFWECPNGGDACKYRHALPPGFVLKRKEGMDARKKDEAEQISLEEFLETERYRIVKTTPVTAESFAKWKLDRKARLEAEEKAKEKEKEAQIRAGKLLHVSGRDLFLYNPDMYQQDDDEAMDVDYSRREEAGEEAEADGAAASEDQDGEFDEQVFLDEDLENLQIEDEPTE